MSTVLEQLSELENKADINGNDEWTYDDNTRFDNAIYQTRHHLLRIARAAKAASLKVTYDKKHGIVHTMPTEAAVRELSNAYAALEAAGIWVE